jgi:hypothetical protein
MPNVLVAAIVARLPCWPEMASAMETCIRYTHQVIGPDGGSYLCSLMHDIFGSPYRSITANPAWLAWNDRTVPKLAQAIYNERAFDRLPILADALEEAGCADAALLDHSRGPGPHVRGCWVVDLLLGKT